MFKISYLFTFILIIFLGCQQENAEWNPTFEETNFDYFKTSIERSLSSIDEAYLETNNNNEEVIQKKLSQVKRNLLEIKDYYIPLTTVRQKIYDAERYLKLDNMDKSKKLLNESKSIITSLELTRKNMVFDKVMLDLNTMINEVIFSLNENSKTNIYKKIKVLSEHINLMLSRGDLVLSGVEFD